MAPHGIYECRGDDQWVAIAARHDDDWHAICDVLEIPELAHDPRYRDVERRQINQDELDRVVEAWTGNRKAADVMDALQAKGVPAAVVQHPQERMDHDANTLAWDTFPEVDHGEMGPVRVEGIPMRFSETPPLIRHGGPLLSNDNDFVYKELLDLDDATLSELHDMGVI